MIQEKSFIPAILIFILCFMEFSSPQQAEVEGPHQHVILVANRHCLGSEASSCAD
jgi:hypothetical protein